MSKGTKPRAIALDALMGGAEAAPAPKKASLGDGGGDSAGGDPPVAINIYVSRADRKRIRQLAMDEEISIQQLGLRAWGLLMREYGLPELTPTTANVPSGRKR